MKENRKHFSLQLPYTNGHSGAVHQETNEIELLELVIAVADIAKRYRLHLFLAILVGLAAGIGWYKSSDPYYESHLTCKINGLEAPAVNHVLAALKQEYQLSEVTLVNELSTNGTFVIKIVVTDPATLPALQQLIIEYIGRNEFVKQAVEIEKSRMTDLIHTLKEEEKRVADVTNQTISGGNLRGEIYSVADLSKLKMDFYKERLQLEGELEQLSAVEIIQGFTKPDQPINKNPWKHITLPTFALLFMVIIVIALIELRTAIHHRKYPVRSLLEK